MEKMKKQFWTSWRSRKSTDIEEVVVDLVEEFARLGKGLRWKIYYFIGFHVQASTLGVSFLKTRFRCGIHQTSEFSSV